MIDLYKAVCAFFIGMFTKTGVIASKSSDIPLNAVVLTSARSDIWCRRGLMEIRVESAKLDILEEAVDTHLKSPEYQKKAKTGAKKFVDSI